jgi:hypothetical protein
MGQADSATYGYKLSAPQYDWKVTLTPGVKGKIKIKAKPFFTETINIGPYWLNAVKVNMGTIHLDAHKGTKTSHTETPGKKTYSSPFGVRR